MKRKCFFVIMVFAAIHIISCSNKVEFNYEDAQKHPWLIPFLQDKTIKEGTHNFSESIIELISEVDSSNEYYLKSDSIAAVEGWIINKINAEKRIYIKESGSKEGNSQIFIMKMEFHCPDLLQIKVY